MKKGKPIFGLLLLAGSFLLLPSLALSQVVTGQYEDEAPMRTWNNLGILTAPAVAMGETQFAIARDCSAALTNPALLSRLPKFSVTINGSLNRASFFRYSLINTGAITTAENIALRVYSWDYAGLSYAFRGWSVALSLALTEYYHRPGVLARATFEGQTYQTLEFGQEGTLRILNFSFARKISSRLALGLGFNFLRGYNDKFVEDKDLFSQVTISDSVKNDFSGFFLNGGLVFDAAEKLTLGLLFRTPYTKKSDSRSERRFLSPAASISSDAAAENTFKQPLVIGAGVCYWFSGNFCVASDLSFFNWRNYEVTAFEEELKRTFKNVLKFGAGLEYRGSIRLFGKEAGMPLRAGFSFDPQPIREPGTSYAYVSLGTGLHLGRFSLDLAALIGEENGSGNDLSAQKFVVSVSYRQ